MTNGFEYDVAISYAGEQRDYARRVAECLRAQSCTVFFDEYEQASLWGRNLNDHLADVYEHKARYCLMLVSREYADKVWTTLERRSAQARALKQKDEYILPVRFDQTEVPGLPHSIGYIEAAASSPERISALVLAKLRREPMPTAVSEPLWRRALPHLRRMRFFILVCGILIGVLLYNGLPRSPIAISFDVWKDLGRDPKYRNHVKLSKDPGAMVAVVVYGSNNLDVRDIDLNSVRLSDGTGSGVPVTWFHQVSGYDENNDGRDDAKFDFKLAQLRSSANLAGSSQIFRVTGYLKYSRRPFQGEQQITFIK